MQPESRQRFEISQKVMAEKNTSAKCSRCIMLYPFCVAWNGFVGAKQATLDRSRPITPDRDLWLLANDPQ